MADLGHSPAERPYGLVIGGGPAGLMAAGEIAARGHKVILAEAKPTLARKFLMAGKSGLNLTMDQPRAAFNAAYSGAVIAPALEHFGPTDTMEFAQRLGIDLFTGSTGRVFPVGMKASPMVRAWAARLISKGVELRTRWRWTGFSAENHFLFETPQGPQTLAPAATVLALGGASWPKLGSDGAWLPWLQARGIESAPFKPANMGFDVAWSAHMERFFGQPVKGAALRLSDRTERGEFVLTKTGLEGGGIYTISAALRDGQPLELDLFPDLTAEALTQRLGRGLMSDSLTNRLRKTLRLEGVRLALAQEWGRPLAQEPRALAARLKALPVPLGPPRPLEEAISSAGGICASALTQDLELTALPGVFAAGEMLDWEAPTGGYLITGALATGRLAGRAAALRLSHLCQTQSGD